MTADLHFSLLEAITARRDRAEAATPGPWFASSGYPQTVSTQAVAQRKVDESTPDDDVWMISTTLTRRPDEDAAFIAAENPAAVLRQVERDLRVLARHQTRVQALGESAPRVSRPDNCWTCDKPSPCLELVDLAAGLGVEVEGNQP